MPALHSSPITNRKSEKTQARPKLSLIAWFYRIALSPTWYQAETTSVPSEPLRTLGERRGEAASGVDNRHPVQLSRLLLHESPT